MIITLNTKFYSKISLDKYYHGWKLSGINLVHIIVLWNPSASFQLEMPSTMKLIVPFLLKTLLWATIHSRRQYIVITFFARKCLNKFVLTWTGQTLCTMIQVFLLRWKIRSETFFRELLHGYFDKHVFIHHNSIETRIGRFHQVANLFCYGLDSLLHTFKYLTTGIVQSMRIKQIHSTFKNIEKSSIFYIFLSIVIYCLNSTLLKTVCNL